ncbi:MAG: N-acetylmuramic acid 6-phosphate etherase [Casimicrobiaceae bacterium]
MTSAVPATEAIAEAHRALDHYDTPALIDALASDQVRAGDVVQCARASLARAVDLALPRMQSGGRLVYVGAGTSGRLGVLDAVELGPTFSWPAERTVLLLAGGTDAMWHAVEGAEDDYARGREEIEAHAVAERDVVLLITASGSTPYVLGAAEAARAAGALTIGLSNNAASTLSGAVDVPIELVTGPEVISGSTRLKAGTAQKMALNVFSSALMVRLNKVYGNLMVDLQASNAKLRRRAVRLTCHATGASEARARQALERAGYKVKNAIVQLTAGVDPDEAERLLAASDGNVAQAIARAGRA